MKNEEKNKRFYDFAYRFLVEKTPSFITEDIIKKYLIVEKPELNCSTINDIFYKMLLSAQNRQMSVNVIGGAIGEIKNLGKVLNNFDVDYVLNKFTDNQNLLDEIEKVFNLKGKIRREEKSLWPQYCKTIISVANFLSQFEDVKDFLTWIDSFYNDKKSMAVLPLLISTEIYGFGFALVCDFLKDLGYENYGKPDVHIKEILSAYGFISEKDSDYKVLKTMIEISHDAQVSCYKLDRILWLIGSGKFFNNPEFGNEGFIGKMKKDFIELLPEFEKEICR